MEDIFVFLGFLGHFSSLEEADLFGVLSRCAWYQGYNARKVISEVYASFVLQCTVYGR